MKMKLTFVHVLAALSVGVAAGAQTQASATAASSSASMTREQITTLATVFVAISKMQDSANELRSQARNKTRQAQQAIQDEFLAQREEILHHAGLTDEEYERKTYLLATDNSVRRMFDSVVAVMTGVPTPGQVAATGRTNLPVPPGQAGVHVGHVINSFGDTPDGMGLLPAAMAEAKIAAQHATLAARDPTNLASMQTHAGHVIHALDPKIVTTGPGRGYGMKKAAEGVATHIELAAKAPGASADVTMHAARIAAAARSAADRADQVIALAQKIQAARTATEAAALVNEMVPLADALITGADTNADGKVTWDKPEGGLQQADEEVKAIESGIVKQEIVNQES